jgi:hypothetical protein
MQHAWRFVDTEPGQPASDLVGACDACGMVRSRAATPDADPMIQFDGDCPAAASDAEPSAAAID